MGSLFRKLKNEVNYSLSLMNFKVDTFILKYDLKCHSLQALQPRISKPITQESPFILLFLNLENNKLQFYLMGFF